MLKWRERQKEKNKKQRRERGREGNRMEIVLRLSGTRKEKAVYRMEGMERAYRTRMKDARKRKGHSEPDKHRKEKKTNIRNA